MNIWILTKEYNEHDQHGEYLIGWFLSNPTAEELEDELKKRDEEFKDYFLFHTRNIVRGLLEKGKYGEFKTGGEVKYYLRESKKD